MAISFYIPISSVQVIQFFCILVSTRVVTIFHFSHSDRYGIISHCGLSCISLVANDVEHFFLPAYLQSVYPLWWNVLFISFVHLYVCNTHTHIYYIHIYTHYICVYILLLNLTGLEVFILDTSLLSSLWFVNIFLLSVACLFILFTGSFENKFF